jgi:hypothetical protein
MQTTTTLAAAGVLAAGLLGAGVALRPHTTDDAIQARIDASAAPLTARVAELEARAERLEKERDAALRQGAEALSAALDAKRDLEKLRDRTDDLMAALSGAGGAARGGASAGLPSAGSPPRGTIVAGAPGAGTGTGTEAADGGGATLAAGSGAGTSEARQLEVVRAAVEQIQREDRERQRRQWEDGRRRMQERRLSDLTQKLGLSPQQGERLQTIWDESAQRREAAFTSMREGNGSPMEMRETMQSIRADEDRKVQETLTAQQYEEYQKTQREQGAMFFGPGPGGVEGRAVIAVDGAAPPPPPPASSSGGGR